VGYHRLGRYDYRKVGLFLFTLRNGNPENWKTLQGKLYAEKILIVGDNQETPMHFHWSKMEDIINRGGGRLCIKLFNATPEEELDQESEVQVAVDSIWRRLPPGGIVSLAPGESISLHPYCYHSFWAEDGRVLAGEVSMVNDDDLDNRFQQKVPRYPVIEEDEPPLHLLCIDYPRYYSWN
jgi:D-lyxose ketol-isomerase